MDRIGINAVDVLVGTFLFDDKDGVPHAEDVIQFFIAELFESLN